MALKSCQPSPTIIWCCSKPTRPLPKRHSPVTNNPSKIWRRAVVVSTAVSWSWAVLEEGRVATGFEFDFGLVAPEQTAEEAESVVREHARWLLEVKAAIDSASWREARTLARKRAAFLKRDLYTIIQSRPRADRPKLRNLYFHLFNNVSKLDFAARDEDASRVLQCYDNIVIALTDILSRI